MIGPTAHVNSRRFAKPPEFTVRRRRITTELPRAKTTPNGAVSKRGSCAILAQPCVDQCDYAMTGLCGVSGDIGREPPQESFYRVLHPTPRSGRSGYRVDLHCGACMAVTPFELEDNSLLIEGVCTGCRKHYNIEDLEDRTICNTCRGLRFLSNMGQMFGGDPTPCPTCNPR